MSQELFRTCPDGYREIAFQEYQEIMGQAMSLTKLNGTLARLQAEQAQAEAVIRSSRAEIRATLSELALVQQAIARTNARLGIESDKRGDILEGEGYAFLCVDKSKRVEALPELGGKKG